MTKLAIVLFLAASCSATQRAEDKAAISCVGGELGALAAILDGSGTWEAKLAAITPELVTCARQAKAAGSGSGSAAPALKSGSAAAK